MSVLDISKGEVSALLKIGHLLDGFRQLRGPLRTIVLQVLKCLGYWYNSLSALGWIGPLSATNSARQALHAYVCSNFLCSKLLPREKVDHIAGTEISRVYRLTLTLKTYIITDKVYP